MGMNATEEAARRLRESNPLTTDTFADAAEDNCGRATFQNIIASSAESAPPARRSSRWRLLLSASVIAAAAAVLLAILLPGRPPPLTRPMHTGWQAAYPLPRAAVQRGGQPGTWRLMSYLVKEGWQRNTKGPQPGYLTCPTAMTCYVQGDNAASASGPADMNSLYVSRDGAVSWDVLPLPPGITFISPLSCGSAVNCAAGALYNGQPVLAVTRDGGHSWIIDPLPAGDSQIFQLSCPTTSSCIGLAAPSAAAPPLGDQYLSSTRFLITTDGGAHFTTSAFPHGTSMQDVSCPTVRDCVAIGVRGVANLTRPGVVAITHDGGHSWVPGTLPQGLGPTPQIICVDAAHCFTLGYKPEDSDLLASADGGRTWAVQPIPASVPDPQLFGLACASETTCYASGEESVPQHFGKVYNASSAMVLITRDSGASWSRVTFPAPARTPRGMQGDAFMAIGDIQCPQQGSCVALGISDQGSRATPVYATRGTP